MKQRKFVFQLIQLCVLLLPSLAMSIELAPQVMTKGDKAFAITLFIICAFLILLFLVFLVQLLGKISRRILGTEKENKL